MNSLISGALLLKIVVSVFIGCIAAYFLCDVQADIEYTWYSGIWHGLFLIPNLILSFLFDGILVKAEISTSGYTFFWWVTVIIQNSSLVKFFMSLLS